MSLQTPTVPHVSVEERLSRLESMATTVAPPSHAQVLATIPTWLKVVNVSTLLAILIAVVTIAFYLGGMSNKLTATAQNVENLNNAVAGANRDSIASRISVIETKLDNIQPKAH